MIVSIPDLCTLSNFACNHQLTEAIQIITNSIPIFHEDLNSIVIMPPD